MTIKKFYFLFVLFSSTVCKAATVDTVGIYSEAMHKSFKCVVIRPDMYNRQVSAKSARNIEFPVVYLLHGWAGDFTDWIKKVPGIKKQADQFNFLIVCPDGGYSSWYFDSPIDSSMRYETYIATEVPAFIDAHYKTKKNRTARAITGLSMGGHGSLFLAFRHADIFGACGSMSGGVDLNDSKDKFNIMDRLGDTIQYVENWKKYSVLNVIETPPQKSLAIIFDCGLDDFFYPGNKNLHQKMLRLKIDHDYIERPGKHDWNYWSNAVGYHFLFFRNYFDRNK